MSGLHDALRAVADADPGRPAIADAATSLTLRALLDAVEREAAVVSRAGVRPGDVVAVTAAGPVEGVVRALAVRRVGAIPCLHARDLATPAAAAWTWSPERGVRRVASPPEVTPPAGTAWLRPTGGTTGTQKIVAFTEAQCLTVVRRAGSAPRLAAGDVIVSTVYPWTGYGWNSATFGPLLAGARVVYAAAPAPRALLDAHPGPVAWRATTAPVVRALARIPVAKERTAGWRVLVAGAAYPAEEAAGLLASHGIAIFDRYGTTEVGLVGQAEEPLGPLVLVPGIEVHGVGDPPRLEVRCHPDTIALGYVAEPGAAEPPPFRGVFSTADVVAFEPDGRFRLRGRGDRLVKRAGRMVDLGAVESAIAALPGVRRARVRAVPGSLDLDLVAVVVAREGGRPDPATLLAEAGRVLASWERPSRVEVLDREPTSGGEKWTEAPGA